MRKNFLPIVIICGCAAWLIWGFCVLIGQDEASISLKRREWSHQESVAKAKATVEGLVFPSKKFKVVSSYVDHAWINVKLQEVASSGAQAQSVSLVISKQWPINFEAWSVVKEGETITLFYHQPDFKYYDTVSKRCYDDTKFEVYLLPSLLASAEGK